MDLKMAVCACPRKQRQGSKDGLVSDNSVDQTPNEFIRRVFAFLFCALGSHPTKGYLGIFVSVFHNTKLVGRVVSKPQKNGAGALSLFNSIYSFTM